MKNFMYFGVFGQEFEFNTHLTAGLCTVYADTQFLSANRLTEEKWPTTFFEYMLENMQLSKFIGESANSVIQTNSDLSKEAGDKVTFRLRMPLSNAGGYDDSDLEGNEEALNFYNFPVEIHERGNAVKSAGKMTEKRTKIQIIREATEALGDWAAEQLDNDLVYALSGIGNQGTYSGEGTSDISTVNEKAPSTNRIWRGGQTAAGVVEKVATDALIDSTTNNLFGTKVIEAVKRKAAMASPKFRPVMINGRGYYILLVHPLQTKALKNETSTVNSWSEIQKLARERGIGNPLFGKQGSGRDRMFDGVVGVWDDCIIYEYDRIQTRVAGEVFDSGDAMHSNVVDGTYRVARALLLGAQAGSLAWGQMWKRYLKDFDYNRKPGTAIDGIYGVSKTQFADPTNTAQEDFATYCIDTACVDDA
jgi:N4-gp56 family major capsid protein